MNALDVTKFLSFRLHKKIFCYRTQAQTHTQTHPPTHTHIQYIRTLSLSLASNKQQHLPQTFSQHCCLSNPTLFPAISFHPASLSLSPCLTLLSCSQMASSTSLPVHYVDNPRTPYIPSRSNGGCNHTLWQWEPIPVHHGGGEGTEVHSLNVCVYCIVCGCGCECGPTRQ